MKLYDLKSLEIMADGDQEFMVEIIEAFIEELPPDIQLMVEAVDSDNAELSYSIVHKMKPNFLLFGLGLENNVANLELWSKHELARKDVLKDVEKIQTRVEKVIEQLKEDYNL
ncbi:Hpt domain-containing protein [Mesonia sp. K7]|uniref:Hpt domain-containing protein n=1 Tax=Mesonia sp. K7 TaxID=2218606 RepID=UPI000DA9DD2A|nr:Hpt domain-containing protein [Mesonia sp. K7]PZD77281.1 Hpt domain-containing protein [Mesonia sp. K7]